VTLRLRDESSRLVATTVKKASCPNCDQEIVLPEDAATGDTVRCCDKDYRITLAFGAYALESMVGQDQQH
jgi:hypothetical protein